MSTATNTGANTPASAREASNGPYQEQLIEYCRYKNWGAPSFQIMSDRRGGRTAWSCSVIIQGHSCNARFWYDGQYVHNAREDAAQMALQKLGQIPVSGVTPAQTLAQASQSTQNQNGGQQRTYSINNR